MRAIKTQNLAKMRTDLALTKASYESINALHTKAVFELSKKVRTERYSVNERQ